MSQKTIKWVSLFLAIVMIASFVASLVFMVQ